MDSEVIVGAAKHGRDWYDVLSLIVGGVGLYYLIRYTHQTKKQREAAEKANELNRHQLVLSRRACVIPSIETETAIAAAAHTVAIDLVNTGGVPATGVRVRRSALTTTVFPQSFEPLTEEPSAGFLHDGVKGRIPLAVTFNERAVELITSDRARAYIYCRIDYSDVFGGGWTSACWRLNWRLSRWVVAEMHNHVFHVTDRELPRPVVDDRADGQMNETKRQDNAGHAKRKTIGSNKQNEPHDDKDGAGTGQRTGHRPWRQRIRGVWDDLRVYEKISVFIQSVSMVALILYACYSCYQWSEMHRQNNLTERAFKQGARARFDPESFTVKGSELHADGEILPLDVTIRNIGRSNARVTVSGKFMVGYGVTVPPCPNASTPYQMSAPINANKTVGFEFAGIQLTPEQVKLVETGRLGVFAVGWIRSTDEVQETHCTLIIANFDPPTSTFRITKNRSVNQTWIRGNINGEELDQY